MFNVLGPMSRVTVGSFSGLYFATKMFGDAVVGNDHPDDGLKGYVHTLALAHGVSSRVLVRQDSEEQPHGKDRPYILGDPWLGNSQIVFPNDSDGTPAQRKVAATFQFGRLYHHHELITNSVALLNLALLAHPLVRLRYVAASWMTTAVAAHPARGAMDRQASKFVHTCCPPRILDAAVEDYFNGELVGSEQNNNGSS